MVRGFRAERLAWPECLNARDLAGMPLDGGARVAAGALIRSDNLTRLTAAGVQAVREEGVVRVVDLRTTTEFERYPSPFGSDPLLFHRPLLLETDSFDVSLKLEQQYAAMLDRHPELFAAAVAAVAEAPMSGPVVVHCHAGKDRAGSVTALTLRLVGASTDAVVDDYTDIDERMLALFDQELAEVTDPTERAQLAEMYTSRPETMRFLLGHLDEAYGGVERYLRQGGLTDDHIAALRTRLRSDS